MEKLSSGLLGSLSSLGIASNVTTTSISANKRWRALDAPLPDGITLAASDELPGAGDIYGRKREGRTLLFSRVVDVISDKSEQLYKITLDGHPRSHHSSNDEDVGVKVKRVVDGISQSSDLKKSAFLDQVKTYIFTHVHTETILDAVASQLEEHGGLSPSQKTFIKDEIDQHRNEIEQRQLQRAASKQMPRSEKLAMLYQCSLTTDDRLTSESSDSDSDFAYDSD